MKKLVICTLVILFASACHSRLPTTNTDNTNQRDSSNKNYLPVADLLKTEIAAVDSFPLRLMRYRIINGKTDSGIITTHVFDLIAKEFLMADLDSSYFARNFEENSFVDRSTNLISFTYSTKDTGYGLKRVDVHVSPGSGSDKLSSIYMEAISGNKDSSIISKMTWKAGKNFGILHIYQPKNGPETTNQTLVVWDSRE
jgi:hypothetical protein